MSVKLESVTIIPLNQCRSTGKIYRRLGAECMDTGRNSWFEEIADLDLILDFRGLLLNPNPDDQCVMLNTKYKRSHSFNKETILKIDNRKRKGVKVTVVFEDEISVDESVCEAVLDFNGIMNTQSRGHIMVKSAIEKVYRKRGWIPPRQDVPPRKMLRGFLLFRLQILK